MEGQQNTTPLNDPKEAVLLQALQDGGKQVDETANHDTKFPDLWELFPSGASSDYTIVEHPAHFVPERVLHLPDVLLEQYERVECRCFMGIFPEINRTWVSIDNQLFLWNYEDETDFSVYNGLDQVIVSVGLVVPRANIFVEDIKYLLVLSTPVEIVLLAVCFEGGSIFKELSIHPTQLSLPTDNVNMLKVIGTQNGRIFLGGKDGCLYELYYQADDGWFTKRCKKINHSKTILASFVPSIFRGREDPLIDLAVDESRHILYTLSQAGNITVYDLGEKGDTINSVASLEYVASQAEKLCPRVKTQQSNKEMKVKSIYVIPRNESKRVHLVAVTSTGIRLYFTTAITGHDLLFESERPSTLEMIHVRLPPDSTRLYGRPHVPPSPSRMPAWGMGGTSPHLKGEIPGPASQLKMGAYEIDTQFYSFGVALMADSSRSEESDSMLMISPDLKHTLIRSGGGTMYGESVIYNSLLEKASVLGIEGKVWSISEVPLSVSLQGRPSEMLGDEKFEVDSSVDVITNVYNLCNELSSQHFLPPRRFLSLTNAGLHMLIKRRPLDILEQHLLLSQGKDTQEIANFFEKYTRSQACAMCLALAARSTTVSSKFNQNLVTYATQAFFKYGGSPHLEGAMVGVDGGERVEPVEGTQPAAARRVGVGGPRGGAMLMGQAVLRRPDVIYSDSHNGFALHLTRLLQLVWNQPLEVLLGMAGSKSGLGQRWLALLEQQLLALLEWLEANPHFAPMPSDLRKGTGPPARLEPDPMDLVDLDGDFGGASKGNIQARLKNLYQRKYDEEAKRVEQRSLANMHALLKRSIEQLAFLSILRGHELQRVYELLPQKEREAIIMFRDLVTSPEGFEVTRQLVSALMSLYTEGSGDSIASTDSVSKTLRTRCPSIFGEEDRIRVKADELLQRAKKTTNLGERTEFLAASLKYYLRIAGHLYRDMPFICEHYQFLHFHEGVVELALRCAAEVDPSNLAVAWYRSARDDEESVGKKTYEIRQELYAYVIAVFDELWAGVPPKFSFVPPEEVDRRQSIDSTDEGFRTRQKMQVLQTALVSKDELFHTRLYQWFIDNELTQQLLENCIKYDSAYIEPFLDANIPQILANYYIMVHKYVKAAETYQKLAEKKGEGIPLKTRVEEYLARAISCAKSCKGQGELLHELQEKMDVAQIQLHLQEDLRKPFPECRDVGPILDQRDDAINALDEELLSVSDLYNRYAKRFGLWECCLDILRVSGHNDPALTKKFWENIILEELWKAEQPGANMDSFITSLEVIGRQLSASESVFPVGWLCNTLEIKSYEYKRWKHGWVLLLMRKVGVSFATLFEIYNCFFDSRDSFWNTGSDVTSKQLHLLRVLHWLVAEWIAFRFSSRATTLDTTKFRSMKVDSHLDKYIMALDTIPGAEAARCRAAFEQLVGNLRRRMGQEY